MYFYYIYIIYKYCCILRDFNMRRKPESAFKIWEFIIYFENLLYASTTCCCNLQGAVLRRTYYEGLTNQCVDIKY